MPGHATVTHLPYPHRLGDRRFRRDVQEESTSQAKQDIQSLVSNGRDLSAENENNPEGKTKKELRMMYYSRK